MLNIKIAYKLVDMCTVLDAVVNFKCELWSVSELQTVAQLSAEPAGCGFETLFEILFVLQSHN